MSTDNLTNAERIIMEVLWKKGEMSNSEIHGLIGEANDWSRHMVKIYTRTLADKGFLEINEISERKIRFYPIVSKETYLANAANGFLRKNYNGLSNMIAGLINNEKVSSEEIEDLERLIAKYKEAE